MTFHIYSDAAGMCRWRLVSDNGRIVADSGEGYASRSNARRAAENVRSKVASAQILDD
jgi:uncharacterized protein YegP (UPF0339 family)